MGLRISHLTVGGTRATLAFGLALALALPASAQLAQPTAAPAGARAATPAATAAPALLTPADYGRFESLAATAEDAFGLELA